MPVWYSISYPFIIHPLIYGTVIPTVYTVVVLSFERLHAICSPLTHEPYFWPYFLMILSSPFTTIIPIFFKFHLDYDESGDIIGYSPAIDNEVYKIYWQAGALILGTVIPMSLLIRNNYIILRSLQNTCRIKRNKTAIVLFVTVAVFLVCHAFRFVVTCFIFYNPITLAQTEYCENQGR